MARAILCILSTLWRYVQVCALCLHSGDMYRSVNGVYNLATREDLYIVLHFCDTCRSGYCVYIPSTCAGLCIVCRLVARPGLCVVSTLWRHVQFCALCLQSGGTSRSVRYFYTLATRAVLCIVSKFCPHL